MSARDGAFPPPAETGCSQPTISELHASPEASPIPNSSISSPIPENTAELNNRGPVQLSRPFSRLVTSSAVAAAFAEVRAKRTEVQAVKMDRLKRLNSRRHTSVAGPPIPASTDSQRTSDHRFSAPTIENAPTLSPSTESPLQMQTTTPHNQLKRAASSGIRERLKAAGSSTALTKRPGSASPIPAFARSSSGAQLRAVPKAAAVPTALASGGNAVPTINEHSDHGPNYEQMMARFQLRRLDRSSSRRRLDDHATAAALDRRRSAYINLEDSELSQRRGSDDPMNSTVESTRPRSEGDQTEGRDVDHDILSSSRAQSRIEESPPRPEAPTFQPIKLQSNSAATVAPAGYLGTISSALGASVRSMASVNNNMPRTSSTQEQTVQDNRQQLATTQKDLGDEAGTPALDKLTKLSSRVGSRPRPLPRFKKWLRVMLTRLHSPMSPFSSAARVRSFLLVLAFCVHVVGFPYEEAFHNAGHSLFLHVDALTEMVFLVDFLLAFNTSFVNKRGVLVVSRRHIAWNFISGPCVFQLLGSLPITTMEVLANGGTEEVVQTEVRQQADALGRLTRTLLDMILRSHRTLHILRLLREAGQVRDARNDKSVWGWLLHSRYSHLLGIVWIVGAVMLISHCVACCWRLLLIDSADENPSSVVTGTCGSPIDSSIQLEVYAECFYVAMQMLQGQSLTTHSARENVFASSINLMGSIVLAVMFGHIAMLVANFNANSTAYQRKMESVFAGMSKMQLPAPLRERIHQYYSHLWREYEALDGAPLVTFAKELSHNLTLEVVLFKYMELAMHVPFWENCSPDFQKTLVLSLDTRVYLPDDFIVRRGEVGDEFYMINRGMCELVGNTDTQEHASEPLARRRSQINSDTSTLYTTSHDGTVYPVNGDLVSTKNSRGSSRSAYVRPDGLPGGSGSVKTLTRGQAFGEMALLMNYQRTANVRAMTYVEMCVLSRTAFQAVLTRYPVDRKLVITQILITSLENNERFGIPCPLLAMVRSVFSDDMNDTSKSEKLITPRRAAKIIAMAVNPNVEDDSIKFALSANLKDQLVDVRDQEFSMSARSEENTPRQMSANVVNSTRNRRRSLGLVGQKKCFCGCHDGSEAALDSSIKSRPEDEEQIAQVESVQSQTLALIQELQRGVQETVDTPSRPQMPPEPNKNLGLLNIEANPIDAEKLGQTRRLSMARTGSTLFKSSVSIHQRRSSFVSSRSTSSPNFHKLGSISGRIADANSGSSDTTTNTNSGDVPKPLPRNHRPIQRAMTSRWLKTSDGTKPLRSPTMFSTPARTRSAAGSSSQRFIQRVTNQLASLANTNSAAQASPTRYADQLFGAMQESLGTTVNDVSYREGRVTSSNMSDVHY